MATSARFNGFAPVRPFRRYPLYVLSERVVQLGFKVGGLKPSVTLPSVRARSRNVLVAVATLTVLMLPLLSIELVLDRRCRTTSFTAVTLSRRVSSEEVPPSAR